MDIKEQEIKTGQFLTNIKNQKQQLQDQLAQIEKMEQQAIGRLQLLREIQEDAGEVIGEATVVTPTDDN